jgi:uncharacterized protein with PIN domain/sulfur carrier protein ThiS
MKITVRWYAELNDFLSPERRQAASDVECDPGRSVKDLLEGLGIPHTEIDLVLLNGEPCGFEARLAAGDRVAAYPVFEGFDIAGVSQVRPEPLREVKFVLDGHLGRLAAFLRLSGFDSLYTPHADDRGLAAAAAAERRILLTRDLGLLKRREVTHGHAVRETDPARQLQEVFVRFDLARLARPFTRCMRCNSLLRPASREEVAGRVPPRSLQRHADFLACAGCGRVFWKGSHFQRLVEIVERAGCRLEAQGAGLRAPSDHEPADR